MSDFSGKNLTGKYKHRFEPSMNNPEVVKKNDWWDELCAKHNTKNHWNKEKGNSSNKDKEE